MKPKVRQRCSKKWRRWKPWGTYGKHIDKWGWVDGKIHCKWRFYWETYSPYWKRNGHILETMVLNPVGIAIGMGINRWNIG
jgi:hypothetical protein